MDIKKSILIIDDSKSIRNYITALLEEANYSVCTAEDGIEGVKLFREGNFDLVITDIFMPVISGLEVVVRLRKEFPTAKIIVLSDGGKERYSDNLDICKALGALCFLSKSKINDELVSIIKESLKDVDK